MNAMSGPTIIDAGDLTPRDIGRRVTIRHDGTEIRGPLSDLRVDTDWITHRTFADNEDLRVAGSKTVTLSVGPWVTTTLPLTAHVEVAR